MPDSDNFQRTFYNEFKKNILCNGINSESPRDGSEGFFKINKICNFPDTLTFPYMLGEPIPFNIGFAENDFDIIIQKCLTSMKTKETSQFLINILLDYNQSILHDILIEILLIEFNIQPEIWEMSSTEKLKMALLHKNFGCVLFKNKNYTKALFQFSEALKYVISFGPEPWPDNMSPNICQLRVLCLTNISACQFINHNYDSVIKNCTKALELDPLYVKALYRRALAYNKNGNFKAALIDANAAHEIESNNRTVTKLVSDLKKSIKNEDHDLSLNLKKIWK